MPPRPIQTRRLRSLSSLLVLALLAAPSVAAERTVRDFGAVGDGKADDTAAIQNAIDAPVGDVLLPRGAYRLTRPLVVDLDRVGFTSIRGTGTATLLMAGPGPAIRLVGTHLGTADPETLQPNVDLRQRMPVVEGLEIVGQHAEAVGIEASGTMRLILEKVTVRDAFHAVHLVRHNRNIIVADCHFYHNRGVGLYLDDCNLHQINVVGCHVSYNAGGGVVVRAGAVRNLQIGTCDIEANTVNVLVDSAGSPSATAEVAVVGCTLQHAGGPGSANVRFLGADAESKRAWGHLVVANNIMSDVACNVDVRKARDVAINGNTLWTGYEHNLLLCDCGSVVVGPNVLGRNPKYEGAAPSNNAVQITGCDDVTISGLLVQATQRVPAGVILEDCRRVNVIGCSVLDCQGAGVLLKNVTRGRVSDCLLRNDLEDTGPWTPIRLVGGRSNMIVHNQLSRPLEKIPETVFVEGNQVAP